MSRGPFSNFMHSSKLPRRLPIKATKRVFFTDGKLFM